MYNVGIIQYPVLVMFKAVGIFVFFIETTGRVRDYDNWRRFLSPSMPVRELHVQYGIDLLPKQRQDSDISCLIRHLAFYFASTLGALWIVI